MKIVMINTLYAPYKVGGAEVSVQLLAEELISNGHDVTVFCLHNHSEMLEETLNGVHIFYFPLKNIYWPFANGRKGRLKKLVWHLIDMYNPWMMSLVGKELARIKPDVVHTNNLSGFSVSVWKAAKKENIKIVHTTRDYYLFHPNSTLFKSGNNIDVNSIGVKLLSAVKKNCSRNVDCFVGISEYISKLHKSNKFGISAAHAYIYNPISHIDFKKDDSGHENVRVGFIGRLTRDKGFDDYCLLAEKYRNTKGIDFYAAGRFGNDMEGNELEMLASASNIKTMGFIKVEDFMASVDVVVLPNKWNEPFGRAVAESANAGKIVYTNFTAGVAEIAKLYQNIFPIQDFNIDYLMTHPTFDINPVRDFDIKHIAEKYTELY
ncbi:TPA: glycosyltransferase family 4 protein [Serratia marcescens]|uniref:glycosyltransferase n=2 Tax=Serratia marcescens TaxID=615 RepID=UPI000745144E|nr:glycosyltransferase [Serratia marcescens]MBH3207287.1 glycosyltransferase [Serratia marcescens]MDP8619639.1 glycosyltransferase [Serratia marcescens]NCI52254.1 glycosyltransferase family 4 protein [Serratia marcescens]NDJ05074.1 glycosyltransferase family 4 protein [Serratia marcescens]NDJ29020.1 glycosyltransferase family 4 protein [Serratia marcescens]